MAQQSPEQTPQQVTGPILMLQAVADQSLISTLSTFAMTTQLTCQHFCEKKSLSDAQEMANSSMSNLTKESIDALELQCNKMC